MIKSMISLDPKERLTCAEYLASYQGTAFPDIFYNFFHPFISSLNEPFSSAPLPPTMPTKTPLPGHNNSSANRSNVVVEAVQPTLRSDADERIERIWVEWEMISEYLDREAAPRSEKVELENKSSEDVSDRDRTR